MGHPNKSKWPPLFLASLENWATPIWRKDEAHKKVSSPKNVFLNPNHRWHYDTPESGDTHRWMTQKQSTSLGRVVALCECGPPVTLCGEFRTVMKREVTVSAFLPFGSGDPMGENKCSAHRSRPVASNETEAVPVCQQQGTRGPS